MNKLNKATFANLLVSTGDLYDKTLTQGLVDIYYAALAKYSDEEVTHGFSEYMTEGVFFPKPADIIRHIKSVEAPAADVNDRAEMGWADVLQKMSSVGPYKNLESDDHQVLATVKSLGGWPRLCEVTDTELTWKKKEFIGNYKSLENTPMLNIPEHMQGLMDESKNKKEGQKQLARLMAGFQPNEQNKLEDQS